MNNDNNEFHLKSNKQRQHRPLELKPNGKKKNTTQKQKEKKGMKLKNQK
ncbi:hypothetical protein R3J31_05760 [Xylella fastidiosa subsp. multiplex]